MDEQQKNELSAFVAALDLRYTATRVPFVIENKEDAKNVHKYMLRWNITLQRNTISMSVDYKQGIGHLPKDLAPKFNGRMLRHEAQTIADICTMRQACTRIKKPELLDVIYCLVMDSYGLESGDFESWASEYGYDTDSRKAEQIYHDCVKQSRSFRALIGGENLNKLRELYQDY